MRKHLNLLLSVCGFTLIETITTLCVACILLALGIPSFYTIIQNNRMSAAVNTIFINLSLARSEAIRRGVDIVVCPSIDGQGCADTTRWDQGFMMYADSNHNRSFDSGEAILRHIDSISESIHISSTIKRKKTVYNPYGHVYGYNLTITFCDLNNTADPAAVIVNNSGRVRRTSTNSGGEILVCSFN